MTALKIRLAISFMALLFCWPAAGNESVDPNTHFAHLMGNAKLTFHEAKIGERVPLNSMIVMPSAVGRGYGHLTIAIDRKLLEPSFIEDLFYGRDAEVIENHPFANKQVHAVLTKSLLIMNIHNGVLMHFRPDMVADSDYRTFAEKDVSAVVLDVDGSVLISNDAALIKDKLDEYYVQWRLAMSPTSSNATTTPDHKIKLERRLVGSEVPRLYPPTVVE